MSIETNFYKISDNVPSNEILTAYNSEIDSPVNNVNVDFTSDGVTTTSQCALCQMIYGDVFNYPYLYLLINTSGVYGYIVSQDFSFVGANNTEYNLSKGTYFISGGGDYVSKMSFRDEVSSIDNDFINDICIKLSKDDDGDLVATMSKGTYQDLYDMAKNFNYKGIDIFSEWGF